MAGAPSNLLSLERWRTLMGINPYLFWGLSNTKVAQASNCDILDEYAWQRGDRIGRDTIRAAIVEAEATLRTYLGYPPAPQYRSATVPFPRPNDLSLSYLRSAGSDARWLSVQLPDGHLQGIGIETVTFIDTEGIAYTDANNDTLLDTATITVVVPAGTLADDIAVYVPVASQPDGLGRVERWRIRPLRVSVTGVNATITGPSWLFVKPMLYEGYSSSPSALNPDTAANYLSSIDVCSRTTTAGTTTATSQGVLEWETFPYPNWACCCEDATWTPTDSSTDPAAIAQAVARVGMRDALAGLVIPGEATYDATTGLWAAIAWDGCRQPDRVIIRYLAGHPLEAGEMAAQWAEIVAGLAAAEIQRPLCGCDAANAKLYWYQTDLARTGGNAGDQYAAVSAQDLDNPIGTRRGHVRAWRSVRALRQYRGFLL